MGNSDSKPAKEKNSIAQPVKKDIIVKLPLEEMIKYFFKDYIIIWHDPNSNSKENQSHKAQLEELCKVLTFTEWEKANDFVQEAKEICHVITSGTNGELLVKEISEKENVCNIYVFCGNKEFHSTWAKNYQKIACVETRIETILNQIQHNLVEWLKREDSLKLNLPAFAPIFNDWDKGQMNSLHLYLKVIPNFKNRVQAKEDFVSLSKRIYSKQGDTKDLEEFEQTYNIYNKEQTLRWYTRESFLYKMTNKCLRIATSDSIQYCRLLLKDIESAIRDQYQAKSKDFNGLLYRGAYLSEGEWSSLKENQDKEIEMHGFLSVSKEKNVALNFMKYDPNQKIFITIIVPKGPNEEEQGFAEIEEFSRFPEEKEILFNFRSRFTVLETEDQYSEELPYRHLVLLYGARGFRRFIAEQNPIEKISIGDLENISIGDLENISCHRCKGKMSESFCFVSVKEQIYSCKKCVDSGIAPFLWVPRTNQIGKTVEAEIKGCLLMNTNQAETPFYGYRCYNCQAKKQKAYFTCIDCSGRQKSWCDDCFDKISECRENGHKMILETSPFSFWRESMSANELNHLKFQNDLVKNNNHLFELGEMYFQSHQYEKAVEYYSLYIQENKEKNKDIQLATSHNNIGRVYDNQREFKKALEHYFKSLGILKSVYGEYHPEVATSLYNIGTVCFNQGEDKLALEYYLKSLNIRKSLYGENHSSVAACIHNIGSVFDKQGDYKTALEYYLKSLDIRKCVSGGDNHPEIANSYNNIGNIYYHQGEYNKVLENYLKSLDINKSVYGDNHPSVATSYNNIGMIYDKQGEYKKAEEHYLKSLEIYKAIYGDNHPEVATSFNNLGSAYFNQGEYSKALEHYLKSLNIKKSFYGKNDPSVATSLHNIGRVYEKHGEYTKALEHYSESLDIRRFVYGDNHPLVATSIYNIGSVYDKQGEYERALEHYLKSLAIDRSVYGENHPEVATSILNIGRVYDKQGEYKKALEYYLKCLGILKYFFGGDNHPQIKSIETRIFEIQSVKE